MHVEPIRELQFLSVEGVSSERSTSSCAALLPTRLVPPNRPQLRQLVSKLISFFNIIACVVARLDLAEQRDVAIKLVHGYVVEKLVGDNGLFVLPLSSNCGLRLGHCNPSIRIIITTPMGRSL